jgi:predicted small secreted protein
MFKGADMRKPAAIAALILTAALLTGCGPVIIGAGGAVLADKVAEDQNGGDGLF